MSMRTFLLPIFFGLHLAAAGLSAQAQFERSYKSSRDSVWSATREVLTQLGISVEKEDIGRGRMQAKVKLNSPIARIACKSGVLEGSLSEQVYFAPQLNLEIRVKSQAGDSTMLHLNLQELKANMWHKGATLWVHCWWNGTFAFEDSVFKLVELRLAQQVNQTGALAPPHGPSSAPLQGPGSTQDPHQPTTLPPTAASYRQARVAQTSKPPHSYPLHDTAPHTLVGPF